MATKRFLGLVLMSFALVIGGVAPAVAGDAPAWIHDLTARSVPPQDDKTDAVVLLDERDVTVVSAEKVHTVVRRAYKILRPGGRDYGTVVVSFNSNEKISDFHGWCIPARGKDYEVKDKDAVEVSLPKVDGSELINDVRAKVLRIPAADPGNIIGYEYEVDERPLLLEDIWSVQREIPVLQADFSLQLPPGWEYKATWLNLPEQKPVQATSNQWHWTVTNQKAVRDEEDMPNIRAIAAHGIFSYFAPGAANVIADWRQMGDWYRGITAGRADASPQIKQKVAALTASATTPLERIRAIAQFVQHNIRYVAIELGIGGLQPHPAAQVFANLYGDCKDKATLMMSMLHAAGIDSYYVVINSERGAVGPNTPAYNAFDHVILAIQLPAGGSGAPLTATLHDTKLGDLLFFDPTDELTPLGSVNGALQANYGMLVGPDGGRLVEVPQEPPQRNGITRTAKLSLDANGTLTGDVVEVRLGDSAWTQRWAQRLVTDDKARIKPIESLLAASLPNFRITKASIANLQETNQPLGFNYSFEAERYAKSAGNLLLVRPRVLGVKTSGLLETREARESPIEFGAPEKDTDHFEITLPAGYVVDELPPPVDAEFPFASYHARSVAKGNVIDYTRTLEIKQLSVPVSQAGELKNFYRIIAGDERNTAVVKPR